MRVRRGLTAAAVLAAVLAPGQAAGQAPGQGTGNGAERPSRVVVVDEAEDVWRADRRTDEWEEAGALPEIDVRRAVVRHASRAVTVRTHLVDLRPGSRTTFWVGFHLPGRQFAFSRVVARRGQVAGGHNLLREPGGAKIRCAGLRHRIDREADTVTVRIPRSCLGDPAWVRANVSAQLVRRGAPNFPYADNVHNDQPQSNVPTPRVWAPR